MVCKKIFEPDSRNSEGFPNLNPEAAVRRCSSKQVFQKILQYTQENKLIKLCNKLYQKEAPKQPFSCECCKIFKNGFFSRAPLITASLNGSAVQNFCFFKSFNNFIESIYLENIQIHVTFNIMCFYLEKVANSFQLQCASYLRCRFNSRCLGYTDYLKA